MRSVLIISKHFFERMAAMVMLEGFMVDECLLQGTIIWTQGNLRLDLKHIRREDVSRYHEAAWKATLWIVKAIVDDGDYCEFSVGVGHITVNVRGQNSEYVKFVAFVQEALTRAKAAQFPA